MKVINIMVMGLVMAGCATVPMPENATMRTGDGPLIQAHRGGRREYDDNAAGGFALALNRGVRGFETDIRFSKDHQLVLMHDARVDRTTDGKGVVEEMTLAELKRCHLKRSGEPVPTLEEMLAPFKGRRDIFVELEMKARAGKFYTPEVLEEYCRKLVATAKANLEPETYIFICFDKTVLETMRRVEPKEPITMIFGHGLTEQDLETAKALGCCGVSPTYKGTTREMIQRAHDMGFLVALWMVQSPAEYAEAKARGADRTTSDYPFFLLEHANGKLD